MPESNCALQARGKLPCSSSLCARSICVWFTTVDLQIILQMNVSYFRRLVAAAVAAGVAMTAQAASPLAATRGSLPQPRERLSTGCAGTSAQPVPGL